MTTDPDDPTPPDPTAGLTDPRTIYPGPDFDGPAIGGSTGPNPAPEAESEPDGRGDPDAEAEDEVRGLVDPREETAGPDAVEG